MPGDWEGHLVFGRGMSPSATLVGRPTRYLMLVGLPAGNHKADTAADVLAGLLRQCLPRRLDLRTLTQDDLDVVALELNERPQR